MHDMLYRLSDRLVCKERVRQGVGILHSESANAYYDAICNGDNKNAWSGKETNIFSAMDVYRSFKRQFVSLLAVRASELDRLPFDLKALIIPAEKGLSDEELAKIEKFRLDGGEVFCYDEYLDSFKHLKFEGKWYETFEIVELYATKIATVKDKKVDLKFLRDEKEYAITVIDFAEDEREIDNLEIELSAAVSGEDCLFVSGDKTSVLPIVVSGRNKKVIIPKLVNGGIIFVNRG